MPSTFQLMTRSFKKIETHIKANKKNRSPNQLILKSFININHICYCYPFPSLEVPLVWCALSWFTLWKSTLSSGFGNKIFLLPVLNVLR